MPSVPLRLRNPSLLVIAVLGALALSTSACGSGPTAASIRPGGTRHDSATGMASRGVVESTSTSPTTAAHPATEAPMQTLPPSGSTPPATAAAGPGQHGPITSPPLPSPGPGFVAGKVTAVGDSVMIDYQTALEQDIPGALVTAAVSRQWTQGEAILAQLKAEGALGAVVIVGLSTNGPIDATQFRQMASILSGASRIVFVNVHVDRTWQDPNNSVLEDGVASTPNAKLVDWDALADQHPTWLYPTQTHLPPEGTGAQALAALVAGTA
ncbi:MAG: hypothetical protein ACRDWE_04540 [Acidimicrobiales bacterium]